uniref:YL1_C domain-containing protein n=1 Tax=Elaeophora elaphi TaxID=1147741 RepID=A0A0R3RTF4_9BILA
MKNSKFVPTPMEIQNLIKPETKQIVKRDYNEISSASLPEYFDPPIEQPQRAEIAYYRCQTDQLKTTMLPPI